MASIQRRPDGTWRARYRDPAGKEHARHFKYRDPDRKGLPHRRPGDSAQEWLDEITAAIAAGTYIDHRHSRVTVGEWSKTWLRAYSVNRLSTVRQAEVHLRVINETFGDRALRDVRASEVKTWVGSLQVRYAPSTVYALHRRLGQLFSDAVHDGLLPRSPVSRRTSPPAPKQRPYVATTEQVWALHDALPDHYKPVVLLGAFAGLRIGEMVALTVDDVDFMRGIITPVRQYPGVDLKTEMSKTPIPIPQELALELSKVPAAWGSDHLVVGAYGRPVTPTTVEVGFKKARETVQGLPEGFRIHDLRHYFASLLISSGLDVKVVQTRLRHASAKTTLDTYGHIWPDKDESARAAVAAVFKGRSATRADSVRTKPASS
ncbi:site-specific recombinase XerD [Microcella putealis]|uniref:Site-specific recombinase XerD n=1 Tax=Microcella putealis TaxID=337005 RepID=A0A4Q7LWX8_9MICO|nr:site-specific integrase [Microcella putealis]RZS58962.1 site-specific recombinase XerD [Microcella putealis]TQM23988.1 site-specific recombinase XerD [Microcella putealis]